MKEIDFVAIKRSEKIYIQVANSIERKETLRRELAPLQAIQDAYPKLLLARTHAPPMILKASRSSILPNGCSVHNVHRQAILVRANQTDSKTSSAIAEEVLLFT